MSCMQVAALKACSSPRRARVIDFDDPANNDWQAVNQFSVIEHKHSRRPDVLLFVNGLPLAVLEQDPFAGHLIVFRGRRGDLIKVIW